MNRPQANVQWVVVSLSQDLPGCLDRVRVDVQTWILHAPPCSVCRRPVRDSDAILCDMQSWVYGYMDEDQPPVVHVQCAWQLATGVPITGTENDLGLDDELYERARNDLTERAAALPEQETP